MIYLDHPVHGSKSCPSESEAQADAANGWIRRQDKKPINAAQNNVVGIAPSGTITLAKIQKQNGKS